MRCPRRPGRAFGELGALVPLNLRDRLSDLVHPALAEIGVHGREALSRLPASIISIVTRNSDIIWPTSVCSVRARLL